jgi:hypothetical protein
METEVCRAFSALTEEIEETVHDLHDGAGDVMASYKQHQVRQAREIASLQFENHILKGDIENEEQWMKRIAFEILDSEQGTLIIGIRVIWVLSQNSCNAMEIIRSQLVMKSITDILASEHRQELLQGSLGILANLCQTSQSRDLFLELHDQQFVLATLESARQVITSSIDPFSKTLELALIFLHNFSLHDVIAGLMRRNGMTATFVVALEKSQENVNLFDTAIATMNTLYQSEHDLTYLTPADASAITRVIKNRPPTSATVQLMTTIRLAFPGL